MPSAAALSLFLSSSGAVAEGVGEDASAWVDAGCPAGVEGVGMGAAGVVPSCLGNGGCPSLTPGSTGGPSGFKTLKFALFGSAFISPTFL